jgi:hypothetical protein
MSWYRRVQKSNWTEKLNIATCIRGTLLLAFTEHTVPCQNGHVKQTVVQNNYSNYQNVTNLNTVNRVSFEFTLITGF